MELTAPDGGLVARINPADATLAIKRDGTTLADAAFEADHWFEHLHGCRWTDGGDVAVGDEREIDETYEMVKGKASERSHEAVATTLTYTHPDADGTVAVDLRVATDGVAFRYRLTGEGRGLTFADGTAFQFPTEAVSWLIPFEPAHEASARQQPILEADGEYCPPGLFRIGDSWVLLSEAGADGDYPTARLAAEDARVAFDHPLSMLDVEYPFETPWRVAVVGDLSTVVESTLVTDLVGPAENDDGWVEPGRVSWSWWSESDSPDDFDRQRDYVDYAAERGWEYTLVDAGWPAEREAVPDLVDYADERDVGIFLWSHWTDVNSESERRDKFATWRDWGVAGVKIDFMNHDDQGRMQFYDAVAEDATEHELLVNFHGSVVPTGLQRRYPHVMTYEGVMGAEYYKWSTLSPEHNATLPFTRNAVGPMDYTPVTFSADHRSTSAGHELALSVVFESALQHFADSVDAYADRPLAESFLESVPAAWDETVLVGGHPGVEATIARRAGDEWFLGTITAGNERIVTVDCSFLDGEWDAEVIHDDGADGLERQEWTVAGDEAMDVVVARNGGFVAHFTQ